MTNKHNNLSLKLCSIPSWEFMIRNVNIYKSISMWILYSAFGKSMCTYKRWWKCCPRASIQAWTHLILFANTFCRSACEMFLVYTVIAVFNSLSVCGWSQYTADFNNQIYVPLPKCTATFQTHCSILSLYNTWWATKCIPKTHTLTG
jgi:hypothetical protein